MTPLFTKQQQWPEEEQAPAELIIAERINHPGLIILCGAQLCTQSAIIVIHLELWQLSCADGGTVFGRRPATVSEGGADLIQTTDTNRR